MKVNTTDDFAKKTTDFTKDKATKATKAATMRVVTKSVSHIKQTRKLKIHKDSIKTIRERRQSAIPPLKTSDTILKREKLLTEREQLLNRSKRLKTSLSHLDVKEEKLIKKEPVNVGKDSKVRTASRSVPNKSAEQKNSNDPKKLTAEKDKEKLNKRSKLDSPLTSKTVGSRNLAQKTVTSPLKAIGKAGSGVKSSFDSEIEESDIAGIQLANQIVSPVSGTLKFETNKFVSRKVGFDRKAYKLNKIEKNIVKTDNKLAKELNAKRKRIRKEAKINSKLVTNNAMALARPVELKALGAMNFSARNVLAKLAEFIKSIRNIKGMAIFGGLALLFLIPMLAMSPIMAMGGGAFLGINSNTTASQLTLTRAMLDEDVLKWEYTVLNELRKYNREDYLDLVLVIIQLESGGRVKDVMQSSESAGLAPNAIQDEQKSIEQGVKYLNDLIIAQTNHEVDIQTLIHSYNYGIGFISYVANNGGQWTQKLADDFSSTQAKQMGWRSYGDPSYVSKAMKYLTVDEDSVSLASAVNPLDFYEEMKAEMEKYSGMAYVWGGKNTQMGFDCSGLTAYLYSLFDIHIDSYTVSQYEQSTAVSLENARAGDLIFFRGTYGGPNFISHVGIYVNETTMFDANSSGVGYHKWNTGYWSQHQPTIRRVITN